MKRFKNKMSLSAPASRNTSRTSSEMSLNSLVIEEILREPLINELNNNNSAQEEIQEIEASMPTEMDEIPDYYKRFTISHPLGNVILRLASVNKELCKKLNIKSQDDTDLSEICARFTDAIKMERNRNINKEQ